MIIGINIHLHAKSIRIYTSETSLIPAMSLIHE